MLPRTKLLAAAAMLAAVAAPASASAGSAHSSGTHCKNVLLSESAGAESFNVTAHGVSCAAAAGVEHQDYRRAANVKHVRTVAFSGWRCVNTHRTFSGNIPYVAVACSASHGRALSFSFQNT